MLGEASPAQKQGLILLKAGGPFQIHDTDTENIFRCSGQHCSCAGVPVEHVCYAEGANTPPETCSVYALLGH